MVETYNPSNRRLKLVKENDSNPEPLLQEVANLTSSLIKEVRDKKLSDSEIDIVMALINVSIQSLYIITDDEYETVALVSKISLFVTRISHLIKDAQYLENGKH